MEHIFPDLEYLDEAEREELAALEEVSASYDGPGEPLAQGSPSSEAENGDRSGRAN